MCPKRTFPSDLGSEILFFVEKIVVCCFVCLFAAMLFPILAFFFKKIGAFIELRKMLLRKKLFDVRLGNCSTPKVLSTHILQIYWIYKDANDLTSRWKVRFRHTFFQNEVQRVLYKLVLVTDPLNYSERIYNPSNFGIIQKQN